MASNEIREFNRRPLTIRAAQYREGQPLPPGVRREERVIQPRGGSTEGPKVEVRHFAGSWVLSDGDWVTYAFAQPYGAFSDAVFRVYYDVPPDEGVA